MRKIDPAEYEKCLQKLSRVLSDMVPHAAEQSLTRCPYKNRQNECTAKFGCRNKRKPRADPSLPACVSDDRLEYRNAWDTEPAGSYEQLRKELKRSAAGKRSADPAGTVTCEGRVCPSAVGKTLFEYADELAARVPSSCGRTGHCHECVVEVKRGQNALSGPSEAEAFLNEPYRLACQATVESAGADLEFSLLRRTPRILTEQTERAVELLPAVQRRGDRVYYMDEEVDEYRGRILGIALDVGTTTMVMEAIDLENGESVYLSSFENPQRFGGSDVMHRISYDGGEFHGELHRAVINALNREIEEMCDRLEITRHRIYEIVVAGNATMRELFFALDVQSIGERPYKSIIEHAFLQGERDTTALVEPARRLKIRANRNARVFGGPLIASHVGADVTADLVAIDMGTQDEVVMLLDVGTNTEVVIGCRGHILTASCPAGPAFEGGLVTFGMPGCDGAIESIRFEAGQFKYHTIGDCSPRGICGSGLIDLLAELRRHDLISEKGVLSGKRMEFEIVPEAGITFSGQDASHLAQAKAANYCGQALLMKEFGVRPAEISRLYLAGAFANYVNISNAIEIGFLAPVPPERIVKIGNAAAQGAREMLLSLPRRNSIEALVKTIRHVELETNPDFFECFVDGCQLKPMPD